ncbi:MAG: metal-dependent transcriptional regulator [Deltaproteobacteria bacterium]|nr:metal-dependent transcriptional regulator [Deltaproteobacteria bacterium]
MADNKIIEEILEFVWSEREAGRDSVKAILEIQEVRDAGGGMETLEGMEKDGLISLGGGVVSLTVKGEVLAREAIRRHRLAERLLTEVLDIDVQIVEESACSFEHSLSAVVADSICTLLGHPPTCPHGYPIPRGECCISPAQPIKPLVMPLPELGIGESARIIFIVSNQHIRLDKLGSLGIMPGSIIKLHQKRPALVVQIGETTLAIDPDIAVEIYVKKV